MDEINIYGNNLSAAVKALMVKRKIIRPIRKKASLKVNECLAQFTKKNIQEPPASMHRDEASGKNNKVMNSSLQIDYDINDAD